MDDHHARRQGESPAARAAPFQVAQRLCDDAEDLDDPVSSADEWINGHSFVDGAGCADVDLPRA